MATITRVDLKKGAQVSDLVAGLSAVSTSLTDTVKNDDRTFIVVKAGSTEVLVTIPVGGSTSVRAAGHGDIPITAITTTISSGDIALLSAPRLSHNNGDEATVQYGSSSGVTVGAYRRVSDD